MSVRRLATRLVLWWGNLGPAWSLAARGPIVVMLEKDRADEIERHARESALARERHETEISRLVRVTGQMRLEEERRSALALDAAFGLVQAVTRAVNDEGLSHRIRRERLREACITCRDTVLKLSADRPANQGAA